MLYAKEPKPPASVADKSVNAIPAAAFAAIVKFGYVPEIVILLPALRLTVWSGAELVIVKLG